MSTARNIGGEDLGQVSSIRQVGVAAFMGAMIEWYDFFLYGLAAAVVFNQLFFPSEEPLAGTLTAFATFGVGFCHRVAGLGRQLLAGCPVHHGGLSYKLRLGLPGHGDIPRRAYRRARAGARSRGGQGRTAT